MQQQPPVMAMVPPFPPTNITTEQIQKYLDENKKLILAILDNQNLGKLAECAQYQALLQKNLMYLAAIADAQPPAPTVPTQMPAHPSMQQGGHYMQNPQAAAMAQQSGVFAQKIPMQFNPQQMQDQQQQQHQHQQQQQQQQQQQHQHQHQHQQQQQHQQQHQQQQQQQQLHHQQQQAMHSHMAMRPGANNGMHVIHSEASLGGGSSGGPPSSTAGLTEFSRGSGAGASSNSVDARGNKQDVLEAGSNDGQGGNSAAGHGSANGEQPSFLKGSAADAN